jgi:hypothetical protein
LTSSRKKFGLRPGRCVTSASAAAGVRRRCSDLVAGERLPSWTRYRQQILVGTTCPTLAHAESRTLHPADERQTQPLRFEARALPPRCSPGIGHSAQKDARLTTEGAVDWPRHGEHRTCQSTERTQTHVTPPRSAQGATTVIFHTFGEQPRRTPASGPIGHYGTCRDRARPLPEFRVVVCGPRPGYGFG